MLTLFTEFMATSTNVVLGAGIGTNIQNLIRQIIGPIFLAIVGLIAITFLMQREIMKMVIFIVIAVVVAALIYVPDMIQNLGTGAGNEIKWD